VRREARRRRRGSPRRGRRRQTYDEREKGAGELDTAWRERKKSRRCFGRARFDLQDSSTKLRRRTAAEAATEGGVAAVARGSKRGKKEGPRAGLIGVERGGGRLWVLHLAGEDGRVAINATAAAVTGEGGNGSGGGGR
jgi:hypothetical protein